MPDVLARDVDEAVELATRWREEGRYDWFRGQTCPWPLVSSFGRLEGPRSSEATELMNRFVTWVCGTPGLEAIAENRDALVAVAQHYGVPTYYVDFTRDPRVAGFFASEHPDRHPGEPGCIICVDQHDFFDLTRSVGEASGLDPGLVPEAVRLEVPGLWRLEAQQGEFLFLISKGIEFWYPPDRILFPQTQTIRAPRKSEIYPERKSPLEILLDQFFDNEKTVKGFARAREWFHKVGVPVHDFAEPVWPLVGLKASPLRSWEASQLEGWLELPVQHWGEAKVKEVRELEVDPGGPPAAHVDRLAHRVSARLASADSPRRGLVKWRPLVAGDSVPGSWVVALELSLDRYWDGVRLLPMTDADISRGMGVVVALQLCRLRGGAGTPPRYTLEYLCDDVIRDPVLLDIGAANGGTAHAIVSRTSLVDSMRSDLDSILGEGSLAKLRSGEQSLLTVAGPPHLLYEFPKLARVFALEAAPSQAVMREGFAMFFSPARLSVIGLP